MFLYLFMLATISISSLCASEEKKCASSYDTCPGLGFKSTEISGVWRELHKTYSTWRYTVLLKNGGSGTCEYEPSGKPAPLDPRSFNFEYFTSYTYPDSVTDKDLPCFTAYPAQYKMVELLYNEKRAQIAADQDAELESQDVQKTKQIHPRKKKRFSVHKK